MQQNDLFEGLYLSKQQDLWKNTIEGEGGHCPCCGKWGKVYKIRLSQHLALALRWMVVHGDEEGWVDVQSFGPRWMLRGKTYPLLEHWGLIESQARRSGIWRATLKGRDFTEGKISMAAAVHVYDNRVWGFEDEDVNFRDCFGKHFNFEAMMSDQFNWANIRETP